MSCRQPASRKAKKAKIKIGARRRVVTASGSRNCLSAGAKIHRLSVLNITPLPRLQALQKPSRHRRIEFRITRFNAKEETVARRKLKTRRVEDRMMRPRQSVERQHPEEGRQGRTQHCQF